jgi:hypothetical protein
LRDVVGTVPSVGGEEGTKLTKKDEESEDLWPYKIRLGIDYKLLMRQYLKFFKYWDKMCMV